MGKKSKIESKGSQVFNVPNTPEGLEFIKGLKVMLNGKDCRISVRGRGTRKEYAKVVGKYTANTSLSLKYAEWFAVYIRSISSDKSLQNAWGEVYKANDKLRAVEAENLRLKATPKIDTESDKVLENVRAQLKASQDENIRLKGTSDISVDLGKQLLSVQNQLKASQDENIRLKTYIQTKPYTVADPNRLRIRVPKGTIIEIEG